MRKLFSDRIGPRHLKDHKQTIHIRAGELVQSLLARRDFDAVCDVAHDLPLNVIFDPIGWPEEVRGEFLGFAIDSFDSCGPDAPCLLGTPGTRMRRPRRPGSVGAVAYFEWISVSRFGKVCLCRGANSIGRDRGPW